MDLLLGPVLIAHQDFPEVDYFLLNEAELTLPPFLRDLEARRPQRLYATAEFADIEQTPAPQWELLDLKRYSDMSIQYSRGCPFNCEYCATKKIWHNRWYARSVGLVRFVGGSLVYELERSALLPGGPDVLALDWADRGTARKSRAGDVVLVGLPAKQGSGYAWTRIDSSDEFLRGSSQAGEFFPDLPSTSETGSDGTVLGTFVYQAEATQATPPGVPALLEFAYVPIGGGAAAYSFSVRIGVDP